jgi:protein SCO1/2
MNANVPVQLPASVSVDPGSQPSTINSQLPVAEPAGIRGFFMGTGLPLFLLAAAVVYEAFLLAVVFAPESTGAWGGFAREFKQWCFRYDTRTGGMEWAAVWVMLVEPAFVLAVTLFLWRRGLRPLRSLAGWRRHAGAAGAGVAAAGLAMAALFAYGRPGADADAPLPFPGERIRTHLAVPAFQFTDQQGLPFALEELRGRVVLVTGIYAMCSTSCPEILQETKALLASLPPEVRGRVSVVAVSLNPEEDSPQLMQAVTEAYGFQHPEFRYLNGPPAGMHAMLMQLGFAAVKNPRTKVIDHANLFLVLDAQGEIAYRFTLDTRHRSWLREALHALAGEAAAP